MQRTYQDKTVLITGASSGIGAEFARQLHAQGAQLILTARSVDRLRKVQAACPGRVVIPGDLTDPDFPARLHAIATGNGRQVDILINNAGYGYYGRLHKGDLTWQLNMIQLNIAALTDLTYRFLPQMLGRPEAGCGIINVASVAVFLPVPHFTVYAAKANAGRPADGRTAKSPRALASLPLSNAQRKVIELVGIEPRRGGRE